MLRCLGIEADDDGLRVEAARVAVAGDIGSGGTDEHEQVGVTVTGRHRLGAAIAQPAGPGGAGVGNGIVGAPIAEDRNPRRGGQVEQVVPVALVPAVPAEDEGGLRGCGNTCGQRLKIRVRGLRFGNRCRFRVRCLGHAHEDILGQADDHGTGATGGRDAHRLGGEITGAILIIDDDDLLRRRGEPFGQAEFLEGLPSTIGDGHEADEEDERGGVLVGGVHGDHRVRSTRTSG